ncbi:hypothetical protein ASPTUDRAFT_40604 [Aspergillus tubingensis CBS 134.48]|uniref:Uncharacterized protein n=1 Tax=Aspergillus tubingensis (strain CBS 134.48) TaxID=767770 RepID=A0A1L9NE60_ASPTC|nr:hypothetical protein ASPTUDRAFT_40604 [Aspergillus tubingensis CBS 134.48]
MIGDARLSEYSQWYSPSCVVGKIQFCLFDSLASSSLLVFPFTFLPLLSPFLLFFFSPQPASISNGSANRISSGLIFSDVDNLVLTFLLLLFPLPLSTPLSLPSVNLPSTSVPSLRRNRRDGGARVWRRLGSAGPLTVAAETNNIPWLATGTERPKS